MTSMRVLALPTTAALLVALSACGGSDGDTGGDSGSKADAAAYAENDAATIRSDFESAMNSVNSMRIAGELAESGSKIALDLSLDRDGNCNGTMTSDAMTFELILTGGDGYLKADAATWDAMAPGTSSVVGDKWVTGFPMDDFEDTCDLDSLLDEMVDAKDDDSDATVAGTGEVDGTPTVKLTSTDDDGTLTIEIAASEPHYVLAASNGDEGSMTFSEFNEPVDVTSPAADDVVDFSNLS